MPTGYAYSARFSNLPAGTQGQGYTNTSCSAFLFHLFGPGTKCWNGGGARARSLNWFHSPTRCSVADDQSGDEGCVPPPSFSYTYEKGVEKVIKVTSDEEAEEISALYAKKDFGTLAKFSPFEGEACYIFQASPISDFPAV
ncbi:hypothetical protein ONZ45_g13542 [Pleurotus djamor]|nr:hypothetical protein ONZ45_g13542 [Pleurotus djamor]